MRKLRKYQSRYFRNIDRDNNASFEKSSIDELLANKIRGSSLLITGDNKQLTSVVFDYLTEFTHEDCDSEIVPIYIPLGDYADDPKNCVIASLRNAQLDDVEIKHLQSKSTCVFIFDYFKSDVQKINLFVANQLYIWKSVKVIHIYDYNDDSRNFLRYFTPFFDERSHPGFLSKIAVGPQKKIV